MPPKKKIINILSSHIKSLINQNKNLYLNILNAGRCKEENPREPPHMG